MLSGSNTPKPQSFTDLFQQQTPLEIIRKKYITKKSQQKRNPQQDFNQLLKMINEEERLIHELEDGLRRYARANLFKYNSDIEFTITNEDPDSNRDSRVKAGKTSQDRALAVTLLFDLLKTSSAYEVYEYVRTPKYQAMIHTDGMFGGAVTGLLRTHLKPIVDNFITKYEKFLELNQNEILIETLLDPNVLQQASVINLADFFWHFNPYLVADVIVNAYQYKQFSAYEGAPKYLTLRFLEEFLAGRHKEYVNKVRAGFKAQLCTNERMKAPGVNRFSEEALDDYQLYQYEDETIVAIEQWIRANYPQRLYNVFADSDLAQLVCDREYEFYLISASNYMLVSDKGLQRPENAPEKSEAFYKWNDRVKRFNKFQADITSLLASYDPKVAAKPILFGGIINFDAHYLNYFISKCPNGEIKVFIVDSSPNIHHDSKKDPKAKTTEHLEKIFTSLFPKCRFESVAVVQMLRERDCGPNSATVIVDVLEKPVFVLSNGEMHFRSENLSIAYAPLIISPYTGTYLYSAQLEEATLNNRALWRDRLSLERNLFYPELISDPDQDTERALTLKDKFNRGGGFQGEYNYASAVLKQKAHDARGQNISTVHSMLLSSQEGQELIKLIVAEYKQSLVLPSSNKIVEYLEQRANQEEIRSLTSAHDNNKNKFAQDVVVTLLREHIPGALENFFKVEALQSLPLSYDLVPQKIVDEYLTSSKCKDIYGSLPIYFQNEIRQRLVYLATIAVQDKHTRMYVNLLNHVYENNWRQYITLVSAPLNANSNMLLTPELILGISNVILTLPNLTDRNNQVPADKILNARQHLHAHKPGAEMEIVSNHIRKHLANTINHIVTKLIEKLDFPAQQIEFLLAHNDWTLNMLNLSVVKLINPALFSKEEVLTLFGALVLAELNARLLIVRNAELAKKIAVFVNEQFKKPTFQQELMQNRTTSELASLLNPQGGIYPNDEFIRSLMALLIKAAPFFNHSDVRDIAHPLLMTSVAQLINDRLNNEFAQTGDAIIDCGAKLFVINSIPSRFPDFQNLESVMQELCNVFFQVPGNYERFAASFIDPQSNNLTPCGVAFHNWLINTRLQRYKDRYNLTLKLADRDLCIDIVSKNLLAILHSQEHAAQVGNLIGEIDRKAKLVFRMRTNLAADINNTSVMNETALASKIQVRDTITLIFSGILKDITQNIFKPGDVLPGSFSAAIRPVLYQLLNIQDIPAILTSREALAVDKRAIALLDDHEYLLNRVVQPHPRLVTLAPVANLPFSFGKPITLNLILDCISYWYTARSYFYQVVRPNLWFASEGMPSLLRELIQIAKDALRSDSPDLVVTNRVIALSLVNDCTLFESKEITDKIIAAITSTVTFNTLTPVGLKFGELASFLALKHAISHPMHPIDEAPVLISDAQIKSEELRRIAALKSADPNVRIDSRALQTQIRNDLMANEKRVRERIKALAATPENQNTDLGVLRQQAERELADVEKRYLALVEKCKQENRQAGNLDNTIDVKLLRSQAEADHYQANIAAIARAKAIARIKQVNAEAVIDNDKIMAIPALERLRYTTEAKNEARTSIGAPNLNAAEKFIDQSFDAIGEDLRSSKKGWLTLFSGESELEKIVRLLPKKHNNEPDFELVEGDVADLMKCITNRWRINSNYYGRHRAMCQYLYTPAREDKLYVAVAEIIVKCLQKLGKQVSTCEILMPDLVANLKFVNRQGNLPPSMCEVYGMTPPQYAESNLGDIPLKNLVITQSGFALDFMLILEQYKIKNMLINPYTEQPFSIAELEDICRHPRANELIHLCLKVNSVVAGISPRGLDILVEYLNTAIFPMGFRENYTPAMNTVVKKAVDKMTAKLDKLPAVERQAFWDETAPPIEAGQAPRRLETIFLEGNVSCLTFRSVPQARIVIAYRGDNHGLLEPHDPELMVSPSTPQKPATELVRRALEGEPIKPRQHVQRLNLQSPAEEYLVDIGLNRKVTTPTIKKSQP